ncbi:B3 domain-containing protein Os01g0234100-like [Papaver somniferum]|uniref:B3 domain-containing protein Os01g0234100-like n=1 Tax=Papaver somniferum TaxID=3469 RepID=UPI000E6F764A|nr:B3 domain-containing protein Os01g0234100-like [Papaver somniferum]
MIASKSALSPSHCWIRVYIVRTTGLAELDGAFGCVQLEACAQKSCLGKAGNDMKPTRKTVVGKPKRLPLPVADQPKNCSEEADSENLEGIRFASSVPEFQDIKNVESFTIIYNDLNIDSEMSKHVRSRYYELCCSQNSFLHKNLVPGLNCKLVAGMICETVNISDAIQSSQVSSTSRDVFQLWRKSLEAFEHLDMNVGFLLPRLDELMKLASEQ